MATDAHGAVCLENEPLAHFIWLKRQVMASDPDCGRRKEALDATLTIAYRNVCQWKEPICTLRHARKVKGIGQWILKMLEEIFPKENDEQRPPDVPVKSKKRYIPQKSSAPFAILLTLYKAMQQGREYMKKQELIDAADGSGLSRMQIEPAKCSGPSTQLGYTTKDCYSSWSSMKTLINKGLVCKSSCPTKYMLTEEGKVTAKECLQRSGALDKTVTGGGLDECLLAGSLVKEVHEAHEINLDNWTAERLSDGRCSGSQTSAGHTEKITKVKDCLDVQGSSDEDSIGVPGSSNGENSPGSKWLHMPPLKLNEKFSDAYDVVLILDNRERFNGKGNLSAKFAEQFKSQFQFDAELRHLPVGDALWIARHKVNKVEYVLDFIVERKKVRDLLQSIRDTRYKQQKLHLMRCGLRKLIYIVEGDPNVIDSADSIKTACLTTEIAEGFDVQRTQDMRDTLRKYGHLTQAIMFQYNELSNCDTLRNILCQTYTEFIEFCKSLEKERVSDVFGVMLMQVKQVTENIALSILERYPTPFLLMLAYLKLEGDERAKEQLLKGLPILNENKEISATVSKKVYHFFCTQGTTSG